jgi:hypothetical protein
MVGLRDHSAPGHFTDQLLGWPKVRASNFSTVPLARVVPSSSGRFGQMSRLLGNQAVWKRFSYPNNWKEPGAMDLEATC